MDDYKELRIEENDDGWFLNGKPISEKTFNEIYNAMSGSDSNGHTCDCNNHDEDCEICEIVDDILTIVKNHDFDYATETLHDYIHGLLSEEYHAGIKDGILNVSDLCKEIVKEIEKE